MRKKIINVGNSKGLILSTEMLEHLQVREAVQIEFRKGEIVLRRPMTIEEAAERTEKRYSRTLKKLSE